MPFWKKMFNKRQGVYYPRSCKKSLVGSKQNRTFAATVPATPLNDAYHGRTSFLYRYMKYDKQPIELSQQLDLLQRK